MLPEMPLILGRSGTQYNAMVTKLLRGDTSTTAVHIRIISYILYVISLLTGDRNSINWPCSQCVTS